MATDTLNGTVQTGQIPNPKMVANAIVTLYEANAPFAEIPPVKTGTGGQFAFSTAGSSSGNVFYLTAKLESGVMLAAIVGVDFPEAVTINELTTVAAAYAFAQFWDNGVIAGDPFGLSLAAGMYENLVSRITGQPSDTLITPPNADQTNALRSIRSLANLLAASVEEYPGAHQGLIGVATQRDGIAPVDSLQAMIHIARHPQSNVDPIYALTQQSQAYTPALQAMPDAWTLAVKVNDTGSADCLFSGPGNLVFDKDGFAWITNNTIQGTPNSSSFLPVLQPNGRAANGRDNSPMSPITGGGLLGGGFGIAIDPSGNIWASNFGWGDDLPSPTGNGSVSEFDSKGNAVSGSTGYQGGTYRVQGIVADPAGNIWLASFENNSLIVFPGGDANNPLPPVGTADGPFGLALAADGSVWLTCSGGMFSHSVSHISNYSLANGEFTCNSTQQLGHSLKGVSIDSQGNIWAASGGDNAVYMLDSAGNVKGKYSGGGIDNPWSATVDGDDNIWVANFGPMVRGSDYIRAGISKLAGANSDPKLGYDTGDPISPSTGYTLPSAGDQVTLANGDPLYGPGRPPSYSPLQRQTSLMIDQAGNVWAINNFKPAFTADARNPGGDGIVIFVGLAKPPAK